MTAAGVVEIPAPTVRVEPDPLPAGARGQLTITLDIPDGCHIQSDAPREPFLIPTSVELSSTGDLTVGTALYPDPVVDRFDWTAVELDVFRGRVEIQVPIEVGPTAAGRVAVAGRLRFQGCTETACLPPVEHPIEVAVEIEP